MIAELEAQVRQAIAKHGLREAFQRLIAGNDRLIRQPELENGRALVTARSVIHREVAAAWVTEQHRTSGYDKPFALVALGGTGRAEVTPCSDLDFALLFDDDIEENPFLAQLQAQLLHSDRFLEACGFKCEPLPFNLDDAAGLTDKQLNSFVDLQPVYDPTGLARRFRERIRGTYDPFQHFLYVRRFWKDHWEKAAGESERLDRFDIKNDGLRVFLAGIWTLAGKQFRPGVEIYRTLDDPRALQAYEFLLRIRMFIHLRRGCPCRPAPDGNHPEDVLTFEDFTSFGELLGPEADERTRFEFDNDVRSRLLDARRRVARFTRAVIQQELKQGRQVGPDSPLVYGVGGLYHATSPKCRTPREKSRAALLLLWAAQRYGVPIDPCELQATFRNAGDWLTLVPELGSLFHETEGSLADSFTFLSQFDGAEDCLFPGYRRFESSLDGRVMEEKQRLRGAIERRKIQILEGYVREGAAMLARSTSASGSGALAEEVRAEVEAALLDLDHLAAVKLALKTKRLPLTPADRKVREDATRPLYERFSTGMSEVDLDSYYAPYAEEADFNPETIRLTEFLIANRRAFREHARERVVDKQRVEDFARLCGSEDRLRSLFVFTCADRAEWECETDDPARWFTIRELYEKTMREFRPGVDLRRAIETAGYSPEQLAILRDFGEDFFAGVYRRYANRFGAHLVRLYEQPQDTGPKVSVLRHGKGLIIGVAASDFRGLAASVSGALWHHRVNLAQAHFFSAMNHGLALDFFHVAPGSSPLGMELQKDLENAIRERRHIAEADEANLSELAGRSTVRPWRPGQYCLNFEIDRDTGGLVYALTYKIFRHLGGNIFALSAHAGRGQGYIDVFFAPPAELSLEEARRIVRERW
ncbi:MAG: hypothetical protein H7A45_00725 [Verrucomicrobiales bacterium]|nr:hypothetical protein [Verrucomicrobiales bacterium]MCP5525212.1 hypothetical protein [Verrucomicrobiales bacterium]